MSSGPEITSLNQLISEIKILNNSISLIEKAAVERNENLKITALDAINFRMREISKLTMNLMSVNLTPTKFSIDEVLVEIAKKEPSSKILCELLEPQLETLRKWALSEILTLSIE